MKIDIYCQTCDEYVEKEVSLEEAHEAKVSHKESNKDHTVNYR